MDKIETHILCPVTFLPENRAVYEITWKNMVQRSRSQVTRGRMRITCWIPKATNTHSEYVLLIAFPLQQRLHERASMLRCTYIACLVEAHCYHVTSSTCKTTSNPQSRPLHQTTDLSPVIPLKFRKVCAC